MKLAKSVLLASALLFCPAAFADSATQKEAAALLDMVGLQNMFEQSIEQMVDIELKQTPALSPYKEVMLKFFGKHMNYTNLKPELVKLYADAFNERELREIIAFYKTPTGKKTIQKMPDLMGKAAQIGMQRMQDNLPELQQMIQAESARIRQLQDTQSKPAPAQDGK